ncbi:SDR family NAD(P)-dependent oxidoreductase [Streptomyces sp. NPDC102383]|uniref:SDR family NAD(P)-dependent oxidoreductase n=1 Tax=unclassified Streptomyces TaxID=2593676 RepID=UPI00382A48E4
MNQTPPRTVIIGASSGFGAALAEHLAASGHRVLAGSRRERPSTASLRHVRLDVTCAKSVSDFSQAADAHLSGGPDGLVFCASDSGAVARAWEVDAEETARVLNVSLLGFVRIVNAFVPTMKKSGRGSIVCVGSGAARTCLDLLSAYGAAKAGLEHYTRCLAHELHDTGVRANVIGIAAETDLAQTHRAAKAELRGRPSSHPPLPPASDNLPLARWLLSDEAAHITGQTIEARLP